MKSGGVVSKGYRQKNEQILILFRCQTSQVFKTYAFSRTLFYFENLHVQIVCHSERSEESEAEGRSFFF